MRVAILDVGSNTARLLVADVMGGRVRPVVEKREHLWLGAEIAQTGTLGSATLRELAHVCDGFARVARRSAITHATTVVTAPGRQGRVGGHLVRLLSEVTGFRVRVLSATEEGRYAYVGAVAAARQQLPDTVAVVDVGGGSTEIAVGDPRAEAAWVRSVDLGAVRLTVTQFDSSSPGKSEVKAARALVRAELGQLTPPSVELALAAGGSARAVAKIVGDPFTATDARDVIRLLGGRSAGRVIREAGIHPRRAEALVGGTLLLSEAAALLDRPLHVARGGVREGAALALASSEILAAA